MLQGRIGLSPFNHRQAECTFCLKILASWYGHPQCEYESTDASFTLADLDLSQAVLSPGLSWNTDYFIGHGIIVVAPEPSRVLLVFLGLCLGFHSRRR